MGREEGRMKTHGIFRAVKLCDTVMMDRVHHTFVKTHRIIQHKQ